MILKKKLVIEVTYDDEITDPESLCSAFAKLLGIAMSTPGIMDEYGNPKVDEFLCPPDVHADCYDDARPSVPPLHVLATSTSYGKELEAIGDHKQSLGSVVMDYHNNKLAVLVYSPTSDEPVANIELCPDVDAARKEEPRDNIDYSDDDGYE